MSKTYTARLADRIREILPDDTEFDIKADPPHWKGYIFVIHPNGADTFDKPWVVDKRAAITEDAVQLAIRIIAHGLAPQGYFTPKWRDLHREAHGAWVAQTGLEL